MYRLEIYKGGFRKFCTGQSNFPVELTFAPVMSNEQPYLFKSKQEAFDAWRMYQKNKPADTTGWFEEVVEVSE